MPPQRLRYERPRGIEMHLDALQLLLKSVLVVEEVWRWDGMGGIWVAFRFSWFVGGEIYIWHRRI